MAAFPGVGSPGYYTSVSLLAASADSLSTGTAKSLTGCSLVLAPGEWDVTAIADFQFGATTSYTALFAGISTTVDTIGAQDTFICQVTAANVPTAANDMAIDAPIARIAATVATTVYLTVKGVFTVSTLKAYGTLRARRVR